VLALIKRVGTHGPACARFPTGLTGELARLATPFADQPFASERYAALVFGSGSDVEESVEMVARRLLK
jgi:hypothetical protein